MADDYNPHFDLSPLRIAMEHMIYRQEMTLDAATLWFILYSAGLLRDNMGIERMREILQQAINELEKENPIV
jgi:hypothetical protein